MELHAIGTVESPLTDAATAPKQGDEGAPEAWIAFADGGGGGARRDRGGRRAARAHLARPRRPRTSSGCTRAATSTRPATGVFATRSPHRPNPIGLHRVTVLEVAGTRLRVRDLEALDGTPVVDVKPVLGGIGER